MNNTQPCDVCGFKLEKIEERGSGVLVTHVGFFLVYKIISDCTFNPVSVSVPCFGIATVDVVSPSSHMFLFKFGCQLN